MAKPNLSIAITLRDLVTAARLDGLRFEIQTYSKSVFRGPLECHLRAYGNELALRQLFNVLRGNLEIKDGSADSVWWGCIWSVFININGGGYGRTLDGQGNSINITYLQQSINQALSGAGTQSTTGFSGDAISITEFGTIQKNLRGANGSATAATARQTRELAQRKNPQKTLRAGQSGKQSGGIYADIVCKSWLETLGWLYYTNNTGAAAGFEKNDVTTSEARQFLGRAHPAKTTIDFIASATIENTAASWAISDVAPYNYIYFTGTSGGSNDKAYRITATNFVGANYTVTPNVTAQAAGPSITTHDVGTKIYQTFTLATNSPFYAAAIDIRLWKNGGPTDNVTVKLVADSSGTPGSTLATGTITNAEIPAYAAWVTATLNTQVSLTFGTTYGILIERTGSEDLTGFNVGVDESKSYSGGVLKLYAGTTSGWVSRPTDSDLIFKVAGLVETTQQISNIIATVSITNSFIPTVQIDTASGLYAVPYQDGTLSALQVIENLVKYGTNNNKRLLMKLLPTRVLVLYEEPAYGAATDMLLETDWVPRELNRAIIPKHRCPYGRWIEFAPLEFYPSDDKYVFPDVCIYNAASDAWQITQPKDRLADLDLTGLKE